jgi:hypothetical protein
MVSNKPESPNRACAEKAFVERRRRLLATQEPQYDDGDQNNAENPTEPGAAIVTMRIITAAAAKEQNQDYEKDDEVHCRGSRRQRLFCFRRVSDCVARPANGVLSLSDCDVDLSFTLQLGVANSLADSNFGFAFYLFDRP